MLQFVLGYGHSEFTRVCIESIYNHTPAREIKLVVWENFSPDPLSEQDIDRSNTILLNMDRNYGCSTALNSMMKDFGLGLRQDVFYISNDHVVFPGWSDPLLENKEALDVVSPMHPFGLPHLHERLASAIDLKDSSKREYLDHPESRSRIKEFLHLIYGSDLERFVHEQVMAIPELVPSEEFWAGCFFLRKEILGQVSTFRTDRGLAADEDALWFYENVPGKLRHGVYGRCYVHHFQCITTNRTNLTMDHAPNVFSAAPVPPLTGYARNLIAEGLSRLQRRCSLTPKTT